MTPPADWRWRLARTLKGLPVDRSFDERYRSDVLQGPGRLEVGAWSHWFPSCIFYTWTPDDVISIGSYASIAAGTTLVCGGEHHTSHLSNFTFNLMTGEDVAVEQLKPSRIVIGSDAWIATQAMVLANVTIGHGAVVGARSVVTADVPPYAIVAGAPARVIRYRFEPEDVTRLLELSWWDWPEVAIRECVPLLRTDDIDGLSRYATAHGL